MLELVAGPERQAERQAEVVGAARTSREPSQPERSTGADRHRAEDDPVPAAARVSPRPAVPRPPRRAALDLQAQGGASPTRAASGSALSPAARRQRTCRCRGSAAPACAERCRPERARPPVPARGGRSQAWGDGPSRRAAARSRGRRRRTRPRPRPPRGRTSGGASAEAWRSLLVRPGALDAGERVGDRRREVLQRVAGGAREGDRHAQVVGRACGERQVREGHVAADRPATRRAPPKSSRRTCTCRAGRTPSRRPSTCRSRGGGRRWRPCRGPTRGRRSWSAWRSRTRSSRRSSGRSRAASSRRRRRGSRRCRAGWSGRR